ncbi:MAG: glycoside hydrolase family 99-like domain-containing protein [Kiritimatiellae bacterium]|nr:glycoside hydrolase family 99-like domain-containing protein [Kiritimatiellia bacterium]
MRRSGTGVWMAAVAAVFAWVGPVAAETLYAWRGDDGMRAWAEHPHQCKVVGVQDAVLTVEVTAWDPFLTGPAVAIPATVAQTVRFRARTRVGGWGELFWVPEGKSVPIQAWSAGFEWIGDGAWHEYRICPFWQGAGKVIAFRIDLPNGVPVGSRYEIADIRVEEETKLQAGQTPMPPFAQWPSLHASGLRGGPSGWLVENRAGAGPITLESPFFSSSIAELPVLVFSAATRTVGAEARVEWMTDRTAGLQKRSFRIPADGAAHTFALDLIEESLGEENLVWLRVVPLTGSGTVTFSALSLCGEMPAVAPDLIVDWAGMADGVNRAGGPVPLGITVRNIGTQDAERLSLTVDPLPEGVRMVGKVAVPDIPGLETRQFRMTLQSDRAVDFTAGLTVTGAGKPLRISVPVKVTERLGLPKADYVPEPKPLKGEYEIGALYFPGWAKIEAWQRIWAVAPERKPLLGWYDEANPEVVDWQIKWAVENGISYFLVDWYWDRGRQHLDHWVKAYRRSRYRSYLKWAVMWANHNGAGSHSEADQRAVTRFWIDHYFGMPEYMKIDGKPVVMVWSPQNMEKDLGEGGCRRLLDLSRQMARDAGYPGIWFIAMKWPEVDTTPETVGKYRDMGFDMTSIYHYMGHGGQAPDTRRYDFKWVAESNHALWEGLQQTGILPFLPNLSTGWDDRPWHGDRGTEIFGKSVDHFRRICADAKRFADTSGVKRLVLAPLNEWGEGSYAEPNTEFGFGFYECVRETFFPPPAGGYPRNFVPKDVGLGPYDLPLPEPPKRVTAWDFRSVAQPDWRALMGVTLEGGGQEGLAVRTLSVDPAIVCRFVPLNARDFDTVTVRMKIDRGTGSAQLFWAGVGWSPIEASSCRLPLKADGAFHDYRFPVGRNRLWRGRINQLRFDPCASEGSHVTIESIRLGMGDAQ